MIRFLKLALTGGVMLALGLAACVPLATPTSESEEPRPVATEPISAATSTPEAPPFTAEPLPTEQLPELVPSSPPPVVEPLPAEIQAKLFADVEARTNQPRSTITILRAESVIWNDGSLGCPTPGVEYTQATEQGYWVVLEVGGKQLDYRVRQRGTFKLCELAQPPGFEPLPPIILPNTPQP
jgi:hypothetical protein